MVPMVMGYMAYMYMAVYICSLFPPAKFMQEVRVHKENTR